MNDLEVRFTVPYEAFADFDPTDSTEPELVDEEWPSILLEPPAEPCRPRAGRNAPCPCGSRRKYKKCHLAADEAEHAAFRPRPRRTRWTTDW